MTDPLDTYCGIYCGACSIRRHGETGRGDPFVACCGDIPAAELACGGCKSGSVYAGCRVCTFRDCAAARGVAHCVECADYPCREYRRWGSLSRLLPHVGEAPGNLEAVRRDGVEGWLAAERLRWSCPECGAPFSWYAATCSACGRSLQGRAHELNVLRRFFCRLILPRVYRKGRAAAPNPR
jgi:hypothetical protein